MYKQFLFLSLFGFMTIIIWIYWASRPNFKNEIYLNNHGFFVKKPVLAPNNDTCKEVPYLVIIVTSYVGHVELRSAHRRTMPQEYLQKYNTKRVFLLAKIPPTEKYITQAAIEDESKVFGDILQGSFVEHYRNLTFKHLMGLEYAAQKCSSATFILKVDDDTVFNFEETIIFLKTHTDVDRQNFLKGYVLSGTKPKREKRNKWFVSYNEFRKEMYPPYLSGWYYITTPQVAQRLVGEAINFPYFWIDDVLVTGILAEAASIKLLHLPHNYLLMYYELVECCLKDMISKNIKCDAVVGPNGNRNNLIYEFNIAARNCKQSKNCTKRIKPLLVSCVMLKDRTIFSSGQAEVVNINI